MEEEVPDEGGRWASFGTSEHDLRMQNRVRDYDPYYIDSRPTMRSGQYADSSPSSRDPTNMKTPFDNQQLAGRRKLKPSAVSHHVIRKEGPNWILIVGGALVTAIGVLIVRKRRPPAPQDKIVQRAVQMPGKDRVQQSGLSFATTRRESTGSRTSEVSTDSPYSGYMLAQIQPQSLSEGSRVGSDSGDEDCIPLSPPAVYSHFSKGSNHSNRTVITPTSPPGSYRGADTSATECYDSLALSPRARLSFSSRRDTMYHLRQQLKSRDEMILEMQAQISDQERTISLHQAHCRDLELRLEAASKTLFESEREVQRLKQAVADYLDTHTPATSKSDKRPAAPPTTQQDENILIKETRRLAEEVRFRECEKQELERLASLRIREHEMVVNRLQELEAELDEARKSGFGKDLLLEAYEVEHENMEDKVVNLERILETKPAEKCLGSSTIGRKSLPGGLGILSLQRVERESVEDDSLNSEDSKMHTRNLFRSFSTLFGRNSERPFKRSTKSDESSSYGDASEDSETEDFVGASSEKLLFKLQQEVEQLSMVLAHHSDTLSKKRLAASRLVDEFQRHNALIDDIQKRVDADVEGRHELQERHWQNVTQYLTFSNDATSAAQVQELSYKLDQIAKQQRVEEEIAELSKHQVKIAELKQRLEKLLHRCKTAAGSNGSLDPATKQQASKLEAAGIELARQLALQEEQARRTSREVRRLSASFELSSPYVPRSKKEELQKMLQDGSSESPSPPVETGPQDPTNMSHVVSGSLSRFSTASEGKPQKSGDLLFDPAISVSSAETVAPQSEGGWTLQDQYVYRPGLSESPIRKSRRGFRINTGSGKELSPGAKRRIARCLKKGASSELARSDSNKWVDRARVQQKNVFTGRESWGDEVIGAVEWSNGGSHNHSRKRGKDCTPFVRPTSPAGRRLSTGSLSDSSTMRMGSPPFAGHNVSLETSIESNKGSFGRFLFNVDRSNQDFVANLDEGRQDGMSVIETPLSPFSTMMATLDLKQSSQPSASLNVHSFGSSITGLSTEMVDEIREGYQQGRRDKSSGSTTVSSISIDSSFDELLDNTLDDLP